jgi:hypothetical protein
MYFEYVLKPCYERLTILHSMGTFLLTDVRVTDSLSMCIVCYK